MRLFGFTKEIDNNLEMMEHISPDSEKYGKIAENTAKVAEIRRRDFDSIAKFVVEGGKLVVIIGFAKLVTDYGKEHIVDTKTISTAVNLFRL